MAKGDHIFVKYPLFEHHAIDVGDGTIVEYGGKGTNRMSVRRRLMREFAGRGEVQVYLYSLGTTLSPDEVVQRALSRVTEEAYDVFNNNCEHFAYWCKTGQHVSPQANTAKGVLTTAAIVGGVALIASAFSDGSPPRDALGRFLPRG
jgi:hypothetical protein